MSVEHDLSSFVNARLQHAKARQRNEAVAIFECEYVGRDSAGKVGGDKGRPLAVVRLFGAVEATLQGASKNRERDGSSSEDLAISGNLVLFPQES